jgi:ribosome-binding protein aMBF1 (putative translation factor)
MTRRANYMDEVRARLAADPESNAAFQKELARLQLARQIAEARKRAGLSQAQLAERIGTKQTGVARMERASTMGFTTTTLAKIAAATGCRLEVQLAAPARRRRRTA